jgi:hypothetical protein
MMNTRAYHILRQATKNALVQGVCGVVLLYVASNLLSSRSLAATERFSGRWAMLQLLATTSQIPVVGMLRSKTETVVLYDLTYREGTLSGEGALCRLRIDSGTELVKTVFSDRFKAALPTPRLNASLTFNGARWIFHQSKQYVVVGASLQTPLKDPLPTKASDPRVLDQDKDSKPGVTVQISGIVDGYIYVAQRNWTELQGSLKAPGRFEGSVLFGNEQNILGATSWVLARGPQAKPDSNNSLFYLVRMSKKASCGQALKAFGIE